MAMSVVKNYLNYSKTLVRNKSFFTNSLAKSMFCAEPKNNLTVSRSLYYMTQSRESNPINSFVPKISLSNNFECKCKLHTKGDQELSAFLTEEAENEKKSQGSPTLPKLEGFEYKLSGAEVEIVKKLEGEMITISANVNGSVDAEETTMDPNEPAQSEPQDAEMKATPDFQIKIVKGKQTLHFECAFSQDMPEEGESYNDTFQITEVSMYEGESTDATYCVSGDIMDGYLYDLLMNYLEERGISNEFADKLTAFFTAYEHQLYINLLQGMKNFVDRHC